MKQISKISHLIEDLKLIRPKSCYAPGLRGCWSCGEVIKIKMFEMHDQVCTTCAVDHITSKINKLEVKAAKAKAKPTSKKENA